MASPSTSARTFLILEVSCLAELPGPALRPLRLSRLAAASYLDDPAPVMSTPWQIVPISAAPWELPVKVLRKPAACVQEWRCSQSINRVSPLPQTPGFLRRPRLPRDFSQSLPRHILSPVQDGFRQWHRFHFSKAFLDNKQLLRALAKERNSIELECQSSRG